MQNIHERLANAFNYAERLDYHPEGNTGRHIFLVSLRALLYTNDVNMVLAGIFHDICKPDSGCNRTDTQGNEYWSNPDHDQQSEQYLNDNWEAYRLIRSMGGDVNQIRGLCRWHMAMKGHLMSSQGLNRNARQVSGLDLFCRLDDMCGRLSVPQSDHPIYIPDVGCFRDYRIDHIGVSPIQRSSDNGEFTVTINRTPFTFGYDRVHEFFRMNPRFNQLTELFRI